MMRAYYFLIQKIIPCILARAIKAATLLISMTYSYKIHGFEQFIEEAKNKPAILALWHQKLLIMAPILLKFTPFFYAALVSKSKDGEILSQVIESYKRGESIRIAHNAKSAGLIGAIGSIKNRQRVLVITPDGPRGPSQEVKKGVFLIAKNASAQIFPMNWRAESSWFLSTWDKMEIPKPFTTINVYIGSALPKDDHTMDFLKEKLNLVQ